MDFPLWGDCSRVARPGVAGLLKPPALSGRESADTETDSAPEREDSEVPRRRARMSHLASDEFSRRRRPGEYGRVSSRGEIIAGVPEVELSAGLGG